jgi:digeranylgeranylglycerophospholipid reductase
MVNCKLEDAHILETYIGREVAPLGYAWVFPKSEDMANVGIGVRGAPAKPYLDRFISTHAEKFHRASIVDVQAAPVPVGGQIKKVAQGGVMVCGDAAGQVIPLTGGGIHTSIAAGKIAGELVGKAVTQGEVDPIEYPKKYLYWSRRIDNSLLSLRLIEKLEDGELNQLADILTGQDIIDLANGLDIERVGRKLLNVPGFVDRLAEALLGKQK